MGLVIFGVMALYLIVSIIVVTVAARAAKKRGKSPWYWGAGAALVMYLIPFWDWIPTVVAHKYYCSTEAGFWVYKTVDQWKAENPGVAEILVEHKGNSTDRTGNDNGFTNKQILNQRFQWITQKQKILPLISMYRWKKEIIDVDNGVVARQIDFSSGESYAGLKFWINEGSCPNGIDDRAKLYQFVDAIVDDISRGNK
ncbi:MAG: hypothetical protein RQ867_03245 [Mariprofundaceae bacterium]|nr:hypothetical protein [Mariprofundaceae bacterium]